MVSSLWETEEILRKFSPTNRNRRALPPKHLKNIKFQFNKEKKKKKTELSCMRHMNHWGGK